MVTFILRLVRGGGGDELVKWAPAGVVFRSAPMLGPLEWSPEGLRTMLDRIEQATKMAALGGADMIIQTGLPIGTANGIGTDKQIIEIMEKVSGLPCTTQITAVVEALRYLEITKVIIVSGYFKETINQILLKFMKDSGFEIVSALDLGMEWRTPDGSHAPDTSQTADVSPYIYYRPSMSLYNKFPQAQGIVIAGGSTPQNDVIEPLETDLGVPVITQRSAALWKVLNMVGTKESIPGLGRLLRRHSHK
ncbi:hypothetical protein ACFL0M_01515 [Thermodesulfobacteriota bacterium]